MGAREVLRELWSEYLGAPVGEATLDEWFGEAGRARNTIVFHESPPAICVLHLRPEGDTQVAFLLPQKPGMFLTLRSLLDQALREHARRFPESVGRPVFGRLSEAAIARVWQTAFPRATVAEAEIRLPRLEQAVEQAETRG
ncbi:MAG: hypothetical protein QW838_04190 [Candidatus Nitrosotenuis sp.]